MRRPLLPVFTRLALGLWLALALALTTVIALVVSPRERPA
jgi:hypothetical protein